MRKYHLTVTESCGNNGMYVNHQAVVDLTELTRARDALTELVNPSKTPDLIPSADFRMGLDFELVSETHTKFYLIARYIGSRSLCLRCTLSHEAVTQMRDDINNLIHPKENQKPGRIPSVCISVGNETLWVTKSMTFDEVCTATADHLNHRDINVEGVVSGSFVSHPDAPC